jgi:hypothetical protein
MALEVEEVRVKVQYDLFGNPLEIEEEETAPEPKRSPKLRAVPQTDRVSTALPRAKTIAAKPMTEREAVEARNLGLFEEPIEAFGPRPQTRGDCLPGGNNEARPCPYASCRYHLAINVAEDGALKIVFPTVDGQDVDWDNLPASCALDVADEVALSGEGPTVDQAGRYLNIMEERARSLIDEAEEKFQSGIKKAGIDASFILTRER